MADSLELTSQHKQFDGQTRYYTHVSAVCRAPMKFSAYLPPAAVAGQKLPVLYWLSGLACNEEIFMTEAQAQSIAKKHGVILVAPDTSPRDLGIEGEDDSYDLGSGAGFYVDATQPKWGNYQMDSYVTRELIEVAEAALPIDPSRRGIFGHSMGGHGALVLGLRHPELYRSISAFAPICAPSRAPWGIKAFGEYLGQDRATWAKYDANEILRAGAGGRQGSSRTPILIDQGTDDEFYAEQLFTDEFEKTARSQDYPATIRRQKDYDHSYYFISTFMDDHVAFHAKNLR